MVTASQGNEITVTAALTKIKTVETVKELLRQRKFQTFYRESQIRQSIRSLPAKTVRAAHTLCFVDSCSFTCSENFIDQFFVSFLWSVVFPIFLTEVYIYILIMGFIVVHQEPSFRNFKAHIISIAVLFQIFMFIITIGVPIVLVAVNPGLREFSLLLV